MKFRRIISVSRRKFLEGTLLTGAIATKTEALVDPRESTGPYVLPGNGSVDSEAVVTAKAKSNEWQAIGGC
ncbi:hypothetical protein [Fischerella sp. JS2]|uniref:hypothetical protein n=1 Tax=Fischerella sp. JS2 TaxID=2597771 RepID=UPI0028E41F3C|nr:hypothetical protein [Fischerella sp. JS2]